MRPVLFAFHAPLVRRGQLPRLLHAAHHRLRPGHDPDRARVAPPRHGSRAHPRHQPVDGRLGHHRRARPAPHRRRPLPRLRQPVHRLRRRSRPSTRSPRYCTTAAQCGYDYLCDTATHKCYPPQDCFAAVKVWRGGLAYYGGFIFAVAFAYYYVRKHKLGWWRTADLAAPGIMLGLVFGRLGCFLNGCCYGKPTTSFLGVVFPQRPGVGRAPDAALRVDRLLRHLRHPLLRRAPAPARLRRRVRRDAHPLRHRALASARSGATTIAASSSASSRRRSSSRSRSSPAASSCCGRRGRSAPRSSRCAPSSSAVHALRSRTSRCTATASPSPPRSSSPSSSARAPPRAPARIPTRCATSASGCWSRR